MMEGSIPIADWRMVAPERKFKVVVVVISNDRAFHFQGISCRLSRESDFSEVTDLLRQWGGKMQVKLAEVESTKCPLLICSGEIDVGKPTDCQRGIMGLGLLNCRLLRRGTGFLGMIHFCGLFASGRILGGADRRGGRGSYRRSAHLRLQLYDALLQLLDP